MLYKKEKVFLRVAKCSGHVVTIDGSLPPNPAKMLFGKASQVKSQERKTPKTQNGAGNTLEI